MNDPGVESAIAPPAGAPDSAGSPPAPRKRLGGSLTRTDVLLAVIAAVMVVFVHDLKYIIDQPYWLDEAWVADSLRAPLGQVPRLASSTPLGWTLLLRLVPAGGLQRQRLVPLAFAALAVAVGYLLGRELRLTRYAAGLLTAVAVLLSPAMLVRDDLKQYTAEAFFALLLWLLVARLENGWSRWRLAALGITASLGTLFAETAILTGGAAFACVLLETLIRRQWRRLAEVAVAGVATLACYGVIFELVVKPRVDPTLSAYWAPFYSPSSVPGAARFFWAELRHLGPQIGFPAASAGSPLALAVALIVAGAGIVALVYLRRFALAALLPVTLIVVMAGSAARQYPFGDERTSTFWLVMFPVLMAIAIATLIHLAGQRVSRLEPRYPSLRGTRVRLPSGRQLQVAWGLPAVAAIVGGLAVGGYAYGVSPDVNSELIAHDDARSQVQYAEKNYRPGDVFLVDSGASYAFAYYYKTPTSQYPVLLGNAAGFIPQYPANSNIMIMAGRSLGDYAPAMRAAIAIVEAEPASEHGRVWVIREHGGQSESLVWRSIFIQLDHTGGWVTVYNLSKLGYKPAYQPLAVYTPPPRAK